MNLLCGGLQLYKLQTVVQCFSKLFFTHQPLLSSLVLSFLMQSLDGHLSEVLFDTKVHLFIKIKMYELIICDITIPILVVTEDIVGDVFQLIVTLFQQLA